MRAIRPHRSLLATPAQTAVIQPVHKADAAGQWLINGCELVTSWLRAGYEKTHCFFVGGKPPLDQYPTLVWLQPPHTQSALIDGC